MTDPASREGASARTDPQAPDPRLRGRTYAIPFDRVWAAAVALADGGLPRWRLVRADDHAGVIVAERSARLLKGIADVRVDVGLDANAQTRVDLRWCARTGGDLGSGKRAISRFVHELDERLGASPAQVLDARVAPTWSS